MRRITFLAALAAFCGCWAEFVAPDADIPIQRLIANMMALVKKEPANASARYVLGRLHSLVFATRAKTTDVYDSKAIPKFPPYSSLRVKKGDSKLNSTDLKHLNLSLENYATATKLKPDEAVCLFGLAWMLEQAAPYAKQVRHIDGATPTQKSADAFKQKAMEFYSRAFWAAREKEMAAGGTMLGLPDQPIAVEAGKELLRLGKEYPSNISRWEIYKVSDTARIIDALPKAITPIIFPVDRVSPLWLLQGFGYRVQFDLAGNNTIRSWPWLNSNAAFLVWDPHKMGSITTGRQLFGSSTFWMFFENGYAALASLDDDNDGYLRGMELTGIRIWRDANCNGISEFGEVTDLYVWKIVAIATEQNAPLANSRGLIFADGVTCPTYDWMPVSTN